MRKVIVKRPSSKSSIKASQYIKSADEDLMSDDVDGLIDDIDDVSDSIDDIQDAVDEIDEDEIDIAVNNNISSHYIAECDNCQGIFISALIQSDQEVDSITGICPLCNEESTQFLKWIIKDVSEDDEK